MWKPRILPNLPIQNILDYYLETKNSPVVLMDTNFIKGIVVDDHLREHKWKQSK